MIAPFAAALQALLHPGTAFQAEPPPLGRAVRNMALVWVPLALVNAALTVSHALQAYGVLRQGAVPAGVLGWLGADPEHLQAQGIGLPHHGPDGGVHARAVAP